MVSKIVNHRRSAFVPRRYFAGTGPPDATGPRRRMTGAKQNRDRLLLAGGVGAISGEGADAASLGEPERRFPAGAIALGRLDVLVGDARRAQGCADSPFAISPAIERVGSSPGKSPVVDIAELGDARDQRVDGGLALFS